MKYVPMQNRLTIAALAIAISSCAQHTSHEVGGMSSSDVFSDQRVRELADAACEGNVGRIRTAKLAGADFNSRGLKDTTVLLWVLSCKNLKGLREILNNGANPNIASSGLFPIVVAARFDDSSFLAELLNHGANPNPETDFKTRTPLQMALLASTFSNNFNNLEILLKHGADVNARTEDNAFSNVVFEAVALNRYREAIMFLDHGYTGDLDKIEIMIGRTLRNPNINDQFKSGMRALSKRVEFEKKKRLGASG